MDFSVIVARDHESVQLGIRKSISDFRHLPIDLVANPEIQGKVPCGPPVILCIDVRPQRSRIRFTASDADLRTRWITQQKIREGIAICQTGRRGRVSWCEIETAARIRRT